MAIKPKHYSFFLNPTVVVAKKPSHRVTIVPNPKLLPRELRPVRRSSAEGALRIRCAEEFVCGGTAQRAEELGTQTKGLLKASYASPLPLYRVTNKSCKTYETQSDQRGTTLRL